MERDQGGMPYRERSLNRRVYAVPDNVPSGGQVPPRSDAEIKSDVETVLFYDSTVPSLGININVANGIVTLTGNVDSSLASRIAFEDAAKVPGVREVRDELNVTSSETASRAAGQNKSSPKPNEPIDGQAPTQRSQTPSTGGQQMGQQQTGQRQVGGQQTGGGSTGR